MIDVRGASVTQSEHSTSVLALCDKNWLFVDSSTRTAVNSRLRPHEIKAFRRVARPAVRAIPWPPARTRCWVGGLLGGSHAQAAATELTQQTTRPGDLGDTVREGIALANPPTVWHRA